MLCAFAKSSENSLINPAINVFDEASFQQVLLPLSL